jgi:hypothetical protein
MIPTSAKRYPLSLALSLAIIVHWIHNARGGFTLTNAISILHRKIQLEGRESQLRTMKSMSVH